ncbi:MULTISPECIES: LamG-like jellyroll fold domain-containing protein [unclassified Rathayibacter]|uniref:LamG-like jellyroll fold domain-containing protein n=1 Tax=unclassified Rathayibacter TaxID=2609250 RepID=UPI00188CEF37|nr:MULTISPECIES: LamG-like jellyroll fold domain-containing protein [unclassified Rathayibacter]MBF4461306.1 family 43 glycosylhydrolase [Rathayibacter sp. VKM Ac-2879]MBF4502717.1 family 43 glycosylhydrolase [Rathayibacter sp. VKM Ac-2878]
MTTRPPRVRRRRLLAAALASLSAAALAAGAAVPVAAAEPSTPPTPAQSLLADFTFDSAPTAGAFTDRSARASVQGTATLVPGRDGQGTAASLSSSFWLNLTGTDGQPLLKGRDSVTFSYDSRPATDGNVGWSLFAARTADGQNYGQEKYLGVLDRTTGLNVERYANTTGRDTSGNLAAPGSGAQWKHVDLVLDGSTARLYVDGVAKSVTTAGPSLSTILSSTGGVLQVGKANWGGGEYFTGLLDNLRVYSRALTGAELGAAPSSVATDVGAALAVPATVLGDLPSQVLGKAVTWTASGAGAARVSSAGRVDTSGLAAPVSVTLQAAVAGVAQTFSWTSTIAAPGGRIATYVKTVTTTNGVKDDPLAYNDDRRADALYAAALPTGASAWEPLNRAQAILYVAQDGDQNQKPNAQMGSPLLFRAKDGSLAAVSSQNNATDSLYLWSSSDGRTFTDQRVVTLAPGSVVTDPRIVFDTARSSYKVFWTDLLTGEGRVTLLADLAAGTTPGATTLADTRTLGVSGAGIPSWAAQNQASDVTLTAGEFDTFYKNYVDLQNTGVKTLAAQVAQGASSSAVAASLPQKAVMEYNDGSTKSLVVDWQDDLSGVDTSKPGSYQVSGVVQQDPEKMVNDARADPHVFLNPDDGYYYLTGSHYGQPSTGPIEESTSYRKIGLKRAKTLAGLATAPEQIVIDPDAGTPGKQSQYPNTFYGWGGYIWAQEFHKINGTWWIVAGMHKGYALTGAWCDNTVLIPYTGTDASIAAGGFFDQTKWGAPVVLEGAPFDVTYIDRQENGATQGYWILPSGNSISIAKAQMGPKGTVPLIAGASSRVYSQSQAWEQGKRSPTPSDTTEGTDQPVVEAPFMVQQGGKMYLTYSGGTVDKYYSLGMLTADATADLQNPASWKQTPFPVLDTSDTYQGRLGADETAYTRQQAGTGHNSFATDESGNLVLAYHARPYPDPHMVTDPQNAGGLFDSDRNTWLKGVNVRANGALDLSLGKDQEVAPGNRTVRVTVTVTGSAVTASAVARCVSGKAVVTVTTKNAANSTADVQWNTAWGARSQQIGAQKTASLAITTRATSIVAGTLQGTATIGSTSTPVSAAYPALRCG